MKLRPFFSYYGGKYRLAPFYGKPKMPLLIEPFAGSAGYSTLHHECEVRLFDLDPVIVGLWRYLIKAKSSEIRSIPITNCADDVKTEEARWLVGFWLNGGSAAPKRNASGRNSWTTATRDRIAAQVDCIRHWQAALANYESIRNVGATWFIDPPYQQAGVYYRKSSKQIDFTTLGDWCRERVGHVIVCENEGADWLPFVPFKDARSSGTTADRNGITKEVIYERDVCCCPSLPEPRHDMCPVQHSA